MEDAFAQLLEQQRLAQENQFELFKHQQAQLLETLKSAFGSRPADHTAIINSLNNRIPTFTYCAEEGETFDRWYGRYEDVIKLDGSKLEDEEKARFIVTKLDRKEAEQFRNHLLPKMPSDLKFADTVTMLRKLFNETKSLARLRYELLTVKFDGTDRKEYTGLVKRRFNVAKWNLMTEDQAQCLLWIIGLQSAEHLDLRLRGLRELELDPNIKLSDLADRLDQVIALRADADYIGGSPATIQAVSNKHRKKQPKANGKSDSNKSKPPPASTSSTEPPSPCYRCGEMHWSRDCTLPRTTTCRNCNRTGHLAKACRQKKEKNRTSNAIFIGQATAGTRNRIYTNVIINGQSIRMQLDTGAEVTLLNHKDWMMLNKPELSPPTLTLRTASKSPIKLKGQFECSFVLNGHSGSGTCHVADTVSLLGMDWIAQDTTLYNHLLHGSVNAVSTPHDPMLASKRTVLEHQLRSTFPTVFQAGLGRCTKVKAKFHMKIDEKPTFRKARPVPYAALPKITEELDRLVEQGVLTATDYSEFATPVVVVEKKDGEIRLCADYSTGLNDSLEKHQHPLPTADDIFTTLNGGKYFTQIDLAEAYLQIEVEDECKKMLTINTHRGLFYYNRMPYGVKPASAIFQQAVDTMISGLDGVAAYMDDIIICGSTLEEHDNRLQNLFRRIDEYGFRVKAAKCSFLQHQINFLGFIVDQSGRRPDPAKTAAISQMPAPTDVTKLRSFLGMVQFYGSFVKDLQKYRAPLDALTKKDVPFEWTKSCQDAFETIKSTLLSDLLLTHYDPNLPIIVAADASNYGIGAVITHRYPDGSEKAVAHASRSLTEAQKGYSQIEKEALGLVVAVEKFHRYIHGRKFTLKTDHKPLLAIFGSKKGIPVYSSNRLQRWAVFLLNYDFDIQYVNTASFGQADALSRLIATNAENLDKEDRLIANVEAEVQAEYHGILRNLPITATHIRKAAKADTTLANVIQHVRDGSWPEVDKSSHLAPFYYRRDSLSIFNDALMFGHRIVIPTSLRKSVLLSLHKAHPGMERMKKLARSYVYWPSIDKEIESLVRNCTDCQAAAKNPVKTTLEPWPTTSEAFERIHIDYAGPINGIYYLVIVDSYSKWPEILPTRSISTTSTIELLTPIFARYGNPRTLVSDNGTQFTSGQFGRFCESRGIRHLRSPPFHPQSNGQAERFVDTFKRALIKMKREGTTQEALQMFLMSYRSTPCASSPNQLSPSENFIGRKMHTVLDVTCPNA